jgi:hypothetical protein
MTTSRSLTTAAVAALTLASLAAGAASARLVFPRNGFSIAPLDDLSPGSSIVAVQMSLAPSDGFAPNVNVQVQPFTGSLEDYVALSRKQFDDMGLTVISENKAGKAATSFEYSGSLRESPLHFYARAEKRGGSVYLATATSTESQWASVGARLKACVDSFSTN